MLLFFNERDGVTLKFSNEFLLKFGILKMLS